MTLHRLSPLALAVVLAGCATLQTSPLNPLTWFGGPSVAQEPSAPDGISAERRPLVPEGAFATIDARPAVARIDALRIDRTPDALLVVADGVAATAGAYNAELVPVAIDGATLVLEFRAALPDAPVAGSPRISAGYVLPAGAALSAVRVRTAANSLSRSF